MIRTAPTGTGRHAGLLVAILLVGTAWAQKGDRPGHVMDDPIPADQIPAAPLLDADQAIASMVVQDGFAVETVAAEPQTCNPVAMVFDGDGRMWVCEMTTYMPDLDGHGEEVPEGTIAILEDADGDGRVDTRTVFLDNIILPRAIALVKGGILYADHHSLYFAERRPDDTPGLHEVVDKDYAKGGSLEHKPNGLLYGLDNWYYNAKSDKRYQALALTAPVPAQAREIYRNAYFKLVKAPSQYRGQWGLAMDDYGRLYHNGNSSAAGGEYLLPGSLLKNPKASYKLNASRIGGNRVYPARMNPGINRGYMKGMLTAEGKLSRFTAASGNVVYRGDNFPDRFYGMSLTPEPAGNLISARSIHEKEGALYGKELFPQAELLASTDERFRPVNLYTAPDGTVYILDLYHGILQHKVFVTTYLRRQLASRELDQGNNDKGRIYRLRATHKEPGPQPRLLTKSMTDLVPDLAHANGWWRDTARQLIVQSGDRSAADATVALIKSSTDERAIINALWTLHGLGMVREDAVLSALTSDSVKVQVNALAVSESLLPTSGALTDAINDLAATATYELAVQIALSAGASANTFPALKTVLTRYIAKPYMREAALSGLAGNEAEFKDSAAALADNTFSEMLAKLGKPKKPSSNHKKLPDWAQQSFKAGQALYTGKAACFGCHGPDGQGLANMGPPLVPSEWVTGTPERLAALMLHGMAGPLTVNGKAYTPAMVMPGLGANPGFKDDDLAAIATFIRNHWGNQASPVKPDLFQAVRARTSPRATPYNAKDLNQEFSP